VPELPDVDVYVAALQSRILRASLERVRLNSPFLLRTVAPPLTSLAGQRVVGVRRLGKRVVIALDDDLFLAIHLMIAGRLHWKPKGAKLAGKIALAALDFTTGTLTLTEAGTKKRASLHVVRGESDLAALGRGGIEPLDATLDGFRAALTRENRTLKRALTDPAIFSGIGNAYSDEILHAAKLSPTQLTRNLDDREIGRLRDAVHGTLVAWRERLTAEAGGEFPEKVTARPTVPGVTAGTGSRTPKCGAPVQRFVYATNEANYCARCQTGGKASRRSRHSSRLLGGDWPRTLEGENRAEIIRGGRRRRERGGAAPFLAARRHDRSVRRSWKGENIPIVSGWTAEAGSSSPPPRENDRWASFEYQSKIFAPDEAIRRSRARRPDPRDRNRAAVARSGRELPWLALAGTQLMETRRRPSSPRIWPSHSAACSDDPGLDLEPDVAGSNEQATRSPSLGLERPLLSRRCQIRRERWLCEDPVFSR
jgi:formamidopyrimidine-DNA glycosylase